MRPDRVRGRSQLTDEQMPCPVQSQACLLLWRFRSAQNACWAVAPRRKSPQPRPRRSSGV
jgi:hypothetical protein